MVLTEEIVISHRAASNLIHATVMSALTFLCALAARDAIIRSMEQLLPEKASEKLIFTYVYAAGVILFTIILAVLWTKPNEYATH
jgi:hypothetical protein